MLWYLKNTDKDYSLVSTDNYGMNEVEESTIITTRSDPKFTSSCDSTLKEAVNKLVYFYE